MKQIAYVFALVGVIAACSDDNDSSVAPSPGPSSSSSSGAPVDTASSSSSSSSSSGTPASASCTEAKDKLLAPVDTVSTGVVTTLSDTSGVKTLFIDASAGGTAGSATNPRIYVNLETATRVDVTDKAAEASTAWDLAIKRPILFTNSGDGGPGQGGAVLIDKAFDVAQAGDGAAATFTAETFFDTDCNAKLDPTGAVLTTFGNWYDYDQATNHLTPHAGTWLVKGATGKLYKLAITSYYANSDGTEGQAGGRYTLKVAPLP